MLNFIAIDLQLCKILMIMRVSFFLAHGICMACKLYLRNMIIPAVLQVEQAL